MTKSNKTIIDTAAKIIIAPFQDFFRSSKTKYKIETDNHNNNKVHNVLNKKNQ